MLKKFKGLVLLSFVLFIAVCCSSTVSAHGDSSFEFDSPRNNTNVSGNVNLKIDVHHTHTDDYVVDIKISGLTVSYNKDIRLLNSDYNRQGEFWQTTWDTSDAPNGRYSITAVHIDDDGGVGTRTINVNVNNLRQHPTKIDLASVKAINNRDVTIYATLRDSNNRVLAGKTVQFIVGGVTRTAVTDNGGIARITHREATGTYTITARFLGDNVYINSEGTSILTIVSSGSIVKVASVSADKGKFAQLRATLTNSSTNQPLSGQVVRFTVNGVVVGSNTTNNNGVAIYNYKVPLNGGKYAILASSSDGFSDSGTLTVRQSSMSFRVTTDNASPLVGNTITLFYRIINNGPDTGTNTVLTYKIPKGFQFVRAFKDAGTHSYNAKTRILTWKLPSAKVGTSLLRLIVRVTNSGRFLLRPKIKTDTYDTSLQNSLSNIYLRTNPDLTIMGVKRSGNTYRITIKNRGGWDAGASSLKISHKVGKKTIQKTYAVKSLAAGQSVVVSAKYFNYSKHKKYEKTAHINHNKKIKEANHNNNKRRFK